MGNRAAQKQRLHLPRVSSFCSTMESVLALSAVIGPEVDKQISWLQSKGLLGRNKLCPACNQPMDMQQRRDITDGHRWRCPVSTCKKSVSLRSGTFFEQSRLQLRQWIVLMYWWAREYPVNDEAEVDKKTAIQVYQYCRDLCSWRLLNHDSPMMLGGQEVVVQIDESLFRPNQKTTVVEPHQERCGSLGSVTPATLLLWGSCVLSPITRPRLCCPSSSNMCGLAQ